jgi:hypothetical protein
LRIASVFVVEERPRTRGVRAFVGANSPGVVRVAVLPVCAQQRDIASGGVCFLVNAVCGAR